MAVIRPGGYKKRPGYVRGAFVRRVWRGQSICQSWPRKRGQPKQPWQKASLRRMTASQKAVKQLPAEDVIPMREGLKEFLKKHEGLRGTAAIRERDLMTQIILGRMWALRDVAGVRMTAVQQQREASDFLDWAEPWPYSLLTRTKDGWLPTVQCKEGAVLVSLATGPAHGCCPVAQIPPQENAMGGYPTEETDFVPPDVLESYVSAILSSSPISYWRLGEDALNENLQDVMGQNSGDWVSGTLGVTGLISSSNTAYMPGPSGYGAIPSNDSLKLQQPFSLEFWFKDTGTSNVVLIEKDGNELSVQRQGGGSNLMKINVGSSSTALKTAGEWNDGDPHHIVFLVNGANSKVYVDGVDDTGSVNVGSPIYGSGDFYIGSRGGSFGYEGVLDEIAIYDHLLTETEIANHYGAGL